MADTKEVVLVDQFGICPKCGRQMGLLHSQFTLYGITPTGKFANRIIEEEEDITAACLCGFKQRMCKTPYGLYPVDHYIAREHRNSLSDPKARGVIGYIEKEKNDG